MDVRSILSYTLFDSLFLQHRPFVYGKDGTVNPMAGVSALLSILAFGALSLAACVI